MLVRKDEQGLSYLLASFALCSLRGPALALRIGNAFARLGRENAPLPGFWSQCLGGLGLCHFSSVATDAGEQSANLCEPCNFGIDH